MTDPDSHKVCRASWYLGNPPGYFLISNTGLSPSMVDFSKSFFYQKILPTVVPQHPDKSGFRLFRFRSPLLTESHLISFPLVTEMFQFTKCPVRRKRRTHLVYTRQGCPIRKPEVSNVCWRTYLCFCAHTHILLRPKLPRHPPLA